MKALIFKSTISFLFALSLMSCQKDKLVVNISEGSIAGKWEVSKYVSRFWFQGTFTDTDFTKFYDLTYDFKEDGHFSVKVKGTDFNEIYKGEYELEEDLLTLHYDGESFEAYIYEEEASNLTYDFSYEDGEISLYNKFWFWDQFLTLK